MSADPTPELLTVRITRAELEDMRALALGLNNIAKMLGANLETKSAILTLMTVVARAQRQ